MLARFIHRVLEHAVLFCREFKTVVGVAGILGVLALAEFVRSAIEHEHPSWGWLCVVLGVALLAEARIVHRLLGGEEDGGKIALTPQQLAEYGRHMQAKET
jgi:hypothetical protein